MNLNILPPTLREKKRYLILEMDSSKVISYEDMNRAIWKACLNAFGEVGTAKMHLWVIRNLYDATTNTVVVKVNRDFVERLRYALCTISQVGESEVCLHVKGVTGTVDSAEKKYLG